MVEFAKDEILDQWVEIVERAFETGPATMSPLDFESGQVGQAVRNAIRGRILRAVETGDSFMNNQNIWNDNET